MDEQIKDWIRPGQPIALKTIRSLDPPTCKAGTHCDHLVDRPDCVAPVKNQIPKCCKCGKFIFERE